MEKELKTAEAQTSIDIYVTCPYCDDYQDRFDDLREHLDFGELRADSCEVELVCEECEETFIVTSITY